MKAFIIVLTVLVVLFVAFQIFITMSTNKTEHQAYEVVQTAKDFEIRFYPSATMASIVSSAKSHKELGNSGFRQLAGYIFGGNDTGQKIAMTSPVHMDINDSLSSMSFVMPAEYNPDNLPRPNDATIKIATVPEEYVAVFTFGGFASDEEIKKNTDKLESLLKANGINHDGNFRYLGYNPPFQLFGRKNEIIVRVRWEEKTTS
jgi:hypothetical protein